MIKIISDYYFLSFLQNFSALTIFRHLQYPAHRFVTRKVWLVFDNEFVNVVGQLDRLVVHDEMAAVLDANPLRQAGQQQQLVEQGPVTHHKVSWSRGQSGQLAPHSNISKEGHATTLRRQREPSCWLYGFNKLICTIFVVATAFRHRDVVVIAKLNNCRVPSSEYRYT